MQSSSTAAQIAILQAKLRESGLLDQIARGEVDKKQAGFMAAGFAMEIAERLMQGGINKKNFVNALLASAVEASSDDQAEVFTNAQSLFNEGLDRVLVWAAQDDNELRRVAIQTSVRCCGAFFSALLRRKRQRSHKGGGLAPALAEGGIEETKQ